MIPLGPRPRFREAARASTGWPGAGQVGDGSARAGQRPGGSMW